MELLLCVVQAGSPRLVGNHLIISSLSIKFVQSDSRVFLENAKRTQRRQQESLCDPFNRMVELVLDYAALGGGSVGLIDREGARKLAVSVSGSHEFAAFAGVKASGMNSSSC